MGNKPGGGSGRESSDSLSAPPVHAGGLSERQRGKSLARGLVSARADSSADAPASPTNGADKSEFAKRVPRGAKYDDVALFKARIAYDDVRYVDRVEQFVRQGGDVNYVPFAMGVYDWTLLHWAAHFRATNTIKFLVSRGANINLKNAEGDVPARIAKNAGASAEILRLLEAGRLLGGR